MEKRKVHLLSFIIPIYNEEDGIEYLRSELSSWLNKLREDIATEIILINDGSSDASLSMLKDWASHEKRVKILSFSRNFGHQNAVSAGLQYAAGDAAVIIDADLQDPLSAVDQMIARYEEGYDVAYG